LRHSGALAVGGGAAAAGMVRSKGEGGVTRMETEGTPDYRPLDADPARSATLPGHFYSAPDIYEAEKQRIFYRHWALVAHRSQLKAPGDYVCAEIADQSVFVMRGRAGELRAFYNVCQHRAHELLKGAGNVKAVIVCPYHAWAYGLDGALRAARHCDALPDFDKADFGLRPVRVEEALGFVFANLDDGAPALAEVCGDMFDDIRANVPWWDEVEASDASGDTGWSGSILEANWKVLAENCLECYHCGPAHPAFVDLIAMESYSCTPHGALGKSFGRLNKGRNKAYDVAPSEPSQTGAFWHLWPNVEISVLPGEASIGAFRMDGAGPERTRLSGIVLTRPGESVSEDRRNYRWNVLWPEDEAICRSVHRGLKSRGYRQGRFVIDPRRPDVSENGVHAFQRRYAAVMGL